MIRQNPPRCLNLIISLSTYTQKQYLRGALCVLGRGRGVEGKEGVRGWKEEMQGGRGVVGMGSSEKQSTVTDS